MIFIQKISRVLGLSKGSEKHTVMMTVWGLPTNKISIQTLGVEKKMPLWYLWHNLYIPHWLPTHKHGLLCLLECMTKPEVQPLETATHVFEGWKFAPALLVYFQPSDLIVVDGAVKSTAEKTLEYIPGTKPSTDYPPSQLDQCLSTSRGLQNPTNCGHCLPFSSSFFQIK